MILCDCVLQCGLVSLVPSSYYSANSIGVVNQRSSSSSSSNSKLGGGGNSKSGSRHGGKLQFYAIGFSLV